METRASYVVVGTFVLAMAVMLFGFVIYIAKVQFDQVRWPYYVYFDGSVTGLQDGSAVRYRGVAVGVVSDIRIAPDDASKVRVTIELPSDTPITQDAVASIEMQGITGLAYIQIFGGARGSPLIERSVGSIPVIPSRPSQISEVLDSAPQLLSNLIDLTKRAGDFLTPENAEKVSGILANTEVLTADAKAALADLRKVAERTDELTRALVDTAQVARRMLSENREPLHDFTTTGLYDAALLIAEMRELVGNMSRIASQVQRDPSGFLLAGPRAGVAPSGSTTRRQNSPQRNLPAAADPVLETTVESAQ